MRLFAEIWNQRNIVFNSVIKVLMYRIVCANFLILIIFHSEIAFSSKLIEHNDHPLKKIIQLIETSKNDSELASLLTKEIEILNHKNSKDKKFSINDFIGKSESWYYSSDQYGSDMIPLKTALSVAIEKKFYKTAQLLVDNGARTRSDSEFSALNPEIIAVQRGDVDAIKFLKKFRSSSNFFSLHAYKHLHKLESSRIVDVLDALLPDEPADRKKTLHAIADSLSLPRDKELHPLATIINRLKPEDIDKFLAKFALSNPEDIEHAAFELEDQQKTHRILQHKGIRRLAKADFDCSKFSVSQGKLNLCKNTNSFRVLLLGDRKNIGECGILYGECKKFVDNPELDQLFLFRGFRLLPNDIKDKKLKCYRPIWKYVENRSKHLQEKSFFSSKEAKQKSDDFFAKLREFFVDEDRKIWKKFNNLDYPFSEIAALHTKLVTQVAWALRAKFDSDPKLKTIFSPKKELKECLAQFPGPESDLNPDQIPSELDAMLKSIAQIGQKKDLPVVHPERITDRGAQKDATVVPDDPDSESAKHSENAQ